MISMKHILILGVWCLSAGLVTADSFNIKKCHCTSDDHVGFVTTYNWTSPDRSPYVWTRSRLYDNWTTKCDGWWGWQCDRNNSTDCWKVRDVLCQPGLGDRSTPWSLKNACTTQDGMKICASMYVMEINGKRHSLDGAKGNQLKGPYKLEADLLYDCSDECQVKWPEKHMRSACTYKNSNKKSNYYGVDIPSRYSMDKGGKLRNHDLRHGGGIGVACQEFRYDYFEL